MLACWHQNVLPGITSQTNTERFVVIISRSRDADPVAYFCRKFGHLCVRGSSRKGNVDKGGKEAKEMMIEALKSGLPGAVTIDGPKGPARIVKPGIVDMALKARVPIVPYTTMPARYKQFNSWDLFRLPRPFTRIVVAYGEPIIVAENASSEDFSQIQEKIKFALDAEEQRVQQIIGS